MKILLDCEESYVMDCEKVEIQKMNAEILDATCGSRMMWFNKENEHALFVDKRYVDEMVCCNGRKFRCKPDIVTDFRKLPFSDNTFSLVVMDPPHLIRAGEKSIMRLKYGILDENWEKEIHDGFVECMRVLRVHGTLIFKWSEVQIPTRKVIKAIGTEPLFGHRSGKKSKTHWLVFMKFNKEMVNNA